MIGAIVMFLTLSSTSGQLCIADECRPLEFTSPGVNVEVDASNVARPFTWVAEDATRAILGVVPPGASELNVALPESRLIVQVSSKDTQQLPALTCSIVKEEERTEWRFVLAQELSMLEIMIAVEPGTYGVSVEASDRTITPREAIEVVLSDDDPLAIHEWRIVPQLEGTVMSASSKELVVDAEVEDERGDLLAVTDIAGRFVIDEPGPESSRVFIVRAPGYGAQYLFVPPDAETVGAIELFEGATVQLTVEHPTAIEPIPLSVRVRHPDPSVPGVFFEGEGVTGERIQIPDLPVGKHVLLIDGPDALQRYAQALEIVGPDIETTVLLEPATLDGKVVYGREPLSGAKIELHGHDGWNASITSADDGSFGGELWDNGDLFAFVTADAITKPYTWGERGPGGDPRIVEIRIPSTILKGHIQSNGNPVEGAKITVTTRSAQTMDTSGAKSDNEGVFELKGIGEGKHSLVVTADGYLRADLDLETTASDDLREVEIELEPGREVQLTVTDQLGLPTANARVFVGVAPDGMNAEQTVLTDTSGRASVTTRPGATTQILVMDWMGSFSQMVLLPDAPDEVAVALVPGTGELQLRVVDGRERPVAGVAFVARYDGLLIPRMPFFHLLQARQSPNATGRDGMMRIPQLPEGRYEMFGYHDKAGLMEILANHSLRSADVDVYVDGRSTIPLTVQHEEKAGNERNLVASAARDE